MKAAKNPYRKGSSCYIAYEFGYLQALDDVRELNDDRTNSESEALRDESKTIWNVDAANGISMAAALYSSTNKNTKSVTSKRAGRAEENATCD